MFFLTSVKVMLYLSKITWYLIILPILTVETILFESYLINIFVGLVGWVRVNVNSRPNQLLYCFYEKEKQFRECCVLAIFHFTVFTLTVLKLKCWCTTSSSLKSRKQQKYCRMGVHYFIGSWLLLLTLNFRCFRLEVICDFIHVTYNCSINFSSWILKKWNQFEISNRQFLVNQVMHSKFLLSE